MSEKQNNGNAVTSRDRTNMKSKIPRVERTIFRSKITSCNFALAATAKAQLCLAAQNTLSFGAAFWCDVPFSGTNQRFAPENGITDYSAPWRADTPVCRRNPKKF
ncbi:MAG: hypothetical protein LBU06_04390 [Desulfovibrio sp.]|jgi:hypothetical protein|nr:hypothetical protein [Desulfovibrio sp.]